MYKLLAILCFFTLLSCRNNDTGIPDVNVNVYVNLFDPNYQQLNGIGSWAYVNGGSKGLVVYHSDVNTFIAYERHCPYDSNNPCSKVSIDQTNFFLVDTCCGSKFQIVDGFPIEGPANFSLLQYRTTFDGNIIHITN